MTLADALDRLVVGTDALADVLSAVRLTACEDRPPGTTTLAVDEFADAIVELAGEAENLRGRVRALVRGSAEPTRLKIEQFVPLVQGILNDIGDGLCDRVLACEHMAELERAARRGGSEWRSWLAATRRGLDECQPTVRAVRDELFACWRELIENPSATGRAAVRMLGDESGGGART